MRGEEPTTHHLAGAPLGPHPRQERIGFSYVNRFGEVGRVRESGGGSVERQAGRALGMTRGEEDRDRSALGHAKEMRLIPSGGVHHGPNVVGALGETSEAKIATGQSSAPL